MPLPVDFDLYLITDRRQAASGDLLRSVEAALDGGVRAVQLREKDLTADELLRLAEQLRALTARYQARLLINSRLDLALAIGADGVHLPSGSTELAGARSKLGAAMLLGMSTHNLAELRKAETCGADFVTFGPVYATPSKLPFGDPVGLEALQTACAQSHLPVFALGGISLARLPELLPTGVAGVALIAGILAAADPQRAAREFRLALETAVLAIRNA
jgi:thiamine-phosphate pyrophosphorylase